MRWLALAILFLVSAPALARTPAHGEGAAHEAPAAHEVPAAAHAPAVESGHAAADAHGAAEAEAGTHGAAHGPNYKAIGVHAINFVLLFAFLFFIARKPVKDLLKQRQASIRKELEDASNARKAAQDRFDELEARLARFEAQVAEMKAGAREDTLREAELVQERTERDIEQMKEATARAIREETRHARIALKRDAVDLAVKLAEERIRGEIGAADQERLASEFLVSLREDNGHA